MDCFVVASAGWACHGDGPLRSVHYNRRKAPGSPPQGAEKVAGHVIVREAKIHCICTIHQMQ